MTVKLEDKHVWTVADFARAMGLSHKQAKALLKRLDTEMGGMLLRRSQGQNRQYTFFAAALMKSKPEVLERVRDLDAKVTDLLEELEELRGFQVRIARQTGENTKAIAQLLKTG